MCKLYDDPEMIEYLKSVGRSEPNYTLCDGPGGCGEKVHIGDHPVCAGVGLSTGHEPPAKYRPFVGFYDVQLGRYIGGLADWNRAMKETGFELSSSKHDRVRDERRSDAPGFDKAFNNRVREVYGGILPVGNFLREDD